MENVSPQRTEIGSILVTVGLRFMPITKLWRFFLVLDLLWFCKKPEGFFLDQATWPVTTTAESCLEFQTAIFEFAFCWARMIFVG